MVVYFQPASLCHLHQTDLIIAPLPSRKQLWEAEDETAWRAENAGYHDARIRYALAGDGELVKFDLGQLCDSSEAQQPQQSLVETSPLRMTGNWDEWCAGMDEFGGLVMLAAALTSCG
jgi:hypothetical protein